MTIEIDKNVFLPEKVTRNKYPWNEMEVGDSFFVPDKTVEQISGTMGVVQIKEKHPRNLHAVQLKVVLDFGVLNR